LLDTGQRSSTLLAVFYFDASPGPFRRRWRQVVAKGKLLGLGLVLTNLEAPGTLALDVAPELALERPRFLKEPGSLSLDPCQDHRIPPPLFFSQFHLSFGHSTFSLKAEMFPARSPGPWPPCL
jgi:hypothetical protein